METKKKKCASNLLRGKFKLRKKPMAAVEAGIRFVLSLYSFKVE